MNTTESLAATQEQAVLLSLDKFTSSSSRDEDDDVNDN